jgi:ATP-dependent Zn protease
MSSVRQNSAGRRGRAVAVDFEFEESPKRRPWVIDALAQVLLRRLVPAGDRRLQQDGIAIIITVPSADYVDPIARAWRYAAAHARGMDPLEISVGIDVEDIDEVIGLNERDTYYEVKRRGEKGGRTGGDAGVAVILAGGRTLVGFAQHERMLPRNLVRIADDRIAISPPDWSAVSEAVTKVTGSSPAETLPDAICQSLSLADLALAERPGDGPDGFVRRLRMVLDVPVAPAPDDQPRLEDIHGMDEAVKWGLTLAADLAEFQAGTLDWRDIDRGVLLTGPPGTGKTSFARALVRTCSARCGAPVGFVAASYARWQAAGHLGDFLKSMQKDFQSAMSQAPAILFLDEIDSFADRNQLAGDNADYGRQCVNGLLEQVDGVGGREGVVLIAATNNPGRVDPALLRPGRLDRIIQIGLPDERALVGIFAHHLPNVQLEGNLAEAAKLAQGATGAKVEQWCRSARRRARLEKRNLKVSDLIDEINASLGPPRDEKARRLAAIHEAGHSYVVAIDAPTSLNAVTIKAIGDSGGATFVSGGQEPIDDAELRRCLRQGLAGRAAELVLLGRITSAAGGGEASDLGRVTAMAVSALASFGLIDEKPRWLMAPAYSNVSQLLQVRPDIALRVEHLLAEAHAEAVAAIQEGREAVQAIADALLAAETLSGTEVLAIVAKNSPAKLKLEMA